MGGPHLFGLGEPLSVEPGRTEADDIACEASNAEVELLETAALTGTIEVVVRRDRGTEAENAFSDADIEPCVGDDKVEVMDGGERELSGEVVVAADVIDDEDALGTDGLEEPDELAADVDTSGACGAELICGRGAAIGLALRLERISYLRRVCPAANSHSHGPRNSHKVNIQPYTVLRGRWRVPLGVVRDSDLVHPILQARGGVQYLLEALGRRKSRVVLYGPAVQRYTIDTLESVSAERSCTRVIASRPPDRICLSD
jgi:hypothetical protein